MITELNGLIKWLTRTDSSKEVRKKSLIETAARHVDYHTVTGSLAITMHPTQLSYLATPMFVHIWYATSLKLATCPGCTLNKSTISLLGPRLQR